MNKERAITFIKNKIEDLKDDLEHEECVEQDWLAVNRLEWEMRGFKEVLNILISNVSDEHNNAKSYIWNKISVIEYLILCCKDRVQKYMLECDLEEYKNVIEVMLANGSI